MSRICFTVTDWVVQEVLEPVEEFAREQQRRCRELAWWNPVRWFCWFVTVLVRIIVWVVREIVVPIFRFVCTVITNILELALRPFLVAFDAIAGTNTAGWTREWFGFNGNRCELQERTDFNADGTATFSFNCRCDREADPQLVTVDADSERDAAMLAREQIQNVC